MAKIIKCSHCGEDNPSDVSKCIGCKKSLVGALLRDETAAGAILSESLVEDSIIYCPNCEWSNKRNYVFCGRCGEQIQDDLQEVEKDEIPATSELKPEIEFKPTSIKTPRIKKIRSKRFDTILKWSLGALIVVGLYNAQPILDEITLASAALDIKDLAQNAGLNKNGTIILASNHPQLVNKPNLIAQCGLDPSGDYLELGCFQPKTQSIFVLKYDRAELKGLSVSNGAHEMLHAAYGKLTDTERAQINELLERQFSALNDPTLNGLMVQYAKDEPGQRDNELHSLIGTEYLNISAELEGYYSKYFSNRYDSVKAHQDVLASFKALEVEVTGIEKKIQDYDTAAKSAYRYHQQAAYNGDAYYTNYNYKIYSDNLAQENKYISQYNVALNDYNDLARSMRGQPKASQYSTVNAATN